MTRRALAAATIGLLAVPAACGDGDLGRRLAEELDPTTTTTAAIGPPPSTTPTTVAAPRATADGDTTTTPPPTSVPAPAPTAPEADEPTGEAVRALVEWEGESIYLHGANLPWLNFGCDFGCGSDGGISVPANREIVSEALRQASEMGMSVVRWWLFPGAPQQITVDADGLPSGLDLRVFGDIDVAIELADQFDLDLIFTLFSDPHDLPEEWITSELGRARLTAVMGELFEHYADVSTIMTWQIFNEPEWSFWLWERFVDVEATRELVRLMADEVHDRSDALVSVGSARLDGLKYWTDMGLDYLTVHWYDPMRAAEHCAICTTYDEIAAALDTDLPVIVGEFYAGEEVADEDRFREFYDRGYGGALPWSLLPERTGDRLEIDPGTATAFGEFVAGVS